MDGSTGFTTGAIEELPDAVTVMDPFHVVRLTGDPVDQYRRRIQQAIHGHRGRRGDPLYRARRTLHTGAGLLTDKQRARLEALFRNDQHVQVEATSGHLPKDDRRLPRTRPNPRPASDAAADRLGQPRGASALQEVITLGRTLAKRAADVLAYSTGPAPAPAPQRPSTAGSSTYAAPPSASATSPITSPVHCWRPAGSSPDYTPIVKSQI